MYVCTYVRHCKKMNQVTVTILGSDICMWQDVVAVTTFCHRCTYQAVTFTIHLLQYMYSNN